MSDKLDVLKAIDELNSELESTSVSEFRKKLPSYINQCLREGRQILVKSYNDPVAALVPVADLARLRAFVDQKLEAEAFSGGEDIFESQETAMSPEDFLKGIPSTGTEETELEGVREEASVIRNLTDTIARLNFENQRLHEQLEKMQNSEEEQLEAELLSTIQPSFHTGVWPQSNHGMSYLNPSVRVIFCTQVDSDSFKVESDSFNVKINKAIDNFGSSLGLVRVKSSDQSGDS